MSSIAAPAPVNPPVWRRLMGFNLLTADHRRNHRLGSSATGSAA